jgi:hypothetical protein
MAARDRLERCSGRADQVQRIGQQPSRILAGGQVDAPLQISDRPRAHPRRLGQVLLRQPGIGAQPPQQQTERNRTLIRHRPSQARRSARV